MTEFKGIQGFDITTGAFLFNPEKAFAVADKLNKGLGKSQWVGIEVYPVQKHKFFGFLQLLPTITVEKVKEWQGKYPNTKVSRVHIEFAYDENERSFMPLHGNFHTSKISQLLQILLYSVIRDAKSGYGLSLARELGVDANVHTNVVYGFAKDGKLAELRNGIPNILIENSIDYNSPIIQGPILYNPSVILREMVEKYQFDKFLLGVDHLLEYQDRQNIDPLDVLKDEKIRKYTQAIHIRGIDLGHGVVGSHDQFYQRFFTKCAKIPFVNPVKVVFDYSPLSLLKYPWESQQVGLFKDAISWIKYIQQTAQMNESIRAN